MFLFPIPVLFLQYLWGRHLTTWPRVQYTPIHHPAACYFHGVTTPCNDGAFRFRKENHQRNLSLLNFFFPSIWIHLPTTRTNPSCPSTIRMSFCIAVIEFQFFLMYKDLKMILLLVVFNTHYSKVSATLMEKIWFYIKPLTIVSRIYLNTAHFLSFSWLLVFNPRLWPGIFDPVIGISIGSF